ncbi:LysR substrate-binding domain-containing protein [Mesorhizobium sp. CAU 1741]|uniref:LysR substrate-binding domain-containing protein n=1 Tax=Mesorhizobium sp. CAU 1741 TaxID=3140366 RepID=UPI00325B0ADF
MLRELPNLDWLRVFASAAATQSFALAAVELGVTPGAVSQRIKSLEAALGVALFQRHAQGVRLTEAGQRYAQRVRPLIEQLAAATRETMGPHSARSLRVTVLPALAQLWLGPRMAQFHSLNEGVTVEIWADPTIVDMRESRFDVALRYGRPPFPGCASRPLLVDELVPVAAPALINSSRLDGHGLPIGVPLMIDTYWPNDFDVWLRHAGHGRPESLIVQTFSLYSMSVEATVNGRGFMIGHTALVGDLIAQGKLQVLSDTRVSASNQFHLLTSASRPLSDTARSFVDWVAGQAGYEGIAGSTIDA